MTSAILSIVGFFLKIFIKDQADRDRAMAKAQKFVNSMNFFAWKSKTINEEYNQQKEGFEKRDEALEDQ